MSNKIEKLIKDTGSKQLFTIGYQAKPARFLGAADIFVLPSSIEGFPLSLLEAMAMGNAVIASRVGAIPDVLDEGETGYVVTPGSAEEITSIINRLAENGRLLSGIKTAARKKVETKYSTIALGENYSRLYAGLLNHKEHKTKVAA